MSKRVSIVLTLISLFVFLQCKGQADWLPAKSGGKYGFIDTNGIQQYPFVMDKVSLFAHNSIVFFQEKGRWGYYNANSGIMLSPQFHDYRWINDSTYSVKKDHWTLIINDSLISLNTTFDTIFIQGCWIYLLSPKRSAIYDFHGVLRHDAWADSLIALSDSVALFRRDQRWGAIKNNIEIIAPSWDSVSIKNTYAYVQNSQVKGAFIPSAKKVIPIPREAYFGHYYLSEKFSDNSPFFLYIDHDDIRIYSICNPDTFIRLPSTPMISSTLRPDYYILKSKQSLLMDKELNIYYSGDEMIQGINKRYFRFIGEKSTTIYDADKKTFDNTITNISFIYDSITSKSFQLIYTGDYLKIADSNSIVLPGLRNRQINRAYLIPGKGFSVYTQARQAIVDFQGNDIIPFRYSTINYADTSLYVVTLNKKMGLCLPNSKEILSPKYDDIEVDEDWNIKAFVGRTMEFYSAGPNFSWTHTATYNNFRRLSVSFSGIRKRKPAIQNPRGNSLSLRWLRDSVVNKIGLFNNATKQYVINPTFDKVQYLSSKNITLTFVNTDTTIYKIGDMAYYTTQKCGLVDNKNGHVLAEPIYLCIFTNDLINYKSISGEIDDNYQTESNICRAIDAEGKFTIIRYWGKPIKPNVSYIHAPQSSKFKCWYGDSIFVSDSAQGKRIMSFVKMHQSISEFLTPYNQEQAKTFMNSKMFLMTHSKDSFTFNRFGTGSAAARTYIDNDNFKARKFIPHAAFPYNYRTFIRKDNLKMAIIYNTQKKTGYINEKGELQIDLIYDDGKGFSNQYALVKQNNLFFFLNHQWDSAFPSVYKKAKPFSEGMAPIKIKNRWGYIDTAGTIVIKPSFSNAFAFSEGKALVFFNNSYHYIDENSNVLFTIGGKKGGLFKNGSAIVSEANRQGLVDGKGEELLKCKYTRISEPNRLGIRIVTLGDNSWLIDNMGKKITKSYRKIIPNSDGLFTFQQGSRFGVLDSSGKVIIKAISEQAMKSGSGFVTIHRGDSVGYISLSDGKRYMKKGSKVFEMSNNFGFYVDNKKMFRLNEQMNIIDSLPIAADSLIFPANRYGCSVFKVSKFYIVVNQAGKDIHTSRIKPRQLSDKIFALASEKNKFFLYNSELDLALDMHRYSEIEPFSEGLAKVTVMGKEGLADFYGQILVKPQFTDIQYYRKGIFRVCSGDKLGYMKVNGELFWDVQN